MPFIGNENKKIEAGFRHAETAAHIRGSVAKFLPEFATDLELKTHRTLSSLKVPSTLLVLGFIVYQTVQVYTS